MQDSLNPDNEYSHSSLHTIPALTSGQHQVNLLYGCRSHLTVSDCFGEPVFFFTEAEKKKGKKKNAFQRS